MSREPTDKTIDIPPTPTKEIHLPDITIGVDGVVIVIALAWFFYKHVIYEKVISRLNDVLRSPIEHDRIKEILPQIGILAMAHRVILISFHNGSVDQNGYHLQKISTLHTYLAPGAPPMAKPISNLPIEKIMYELVGLFTSETGWDTIEKSKDFPPSCRAHLDLNLIHKMHNKLLMAGNLPIGILSIQYTDNLEMKEMTDSDLSSPLMEDLIDSLTIILKARITDKGALAKILDQIKSFTS